MLIFLKSKSALKHFSSSFLKRKSKVLVLKVKEASPGKMRSGAVHQENSKVAKANQIQTKPKYTSDR